MTNSLKSLFLNPAPLDLHEKLHRHACVAVILRGQKMEDLEVAFIQRAFNPDDRWSGHIAFPGGKREESDASDLDAALRETQEEVGLQLSPDELVGRLDDIQARKSGTMLDFYIRPFVFHIDREFGITLDASEVADFFWTPLKEILSPHRQTFYGVVRDTGGIRLPAVHLDRDPPLWGLTYMMILNLFDRLKLSAYKSSTVKNL
ncbi:NUDIX hydrolase [Bdellovibrio reynosensis]|uniref:CoA pyrophosphatase n=1 Tax=Bdellovibrio reynosensis TaxID=2835041 RepID=A0ABY4CCA4_9BACT|nr:CoA pyrophosphatase [Bdellovibrio reynosensis]UOE99829.1 CoA pyrophosphatase [Bdellovibrio reynosensis]